MAHSMKHSSKPAARQASRSCWVIATTLAIALSLCDSVFAQNVDVDWPSWRGPRGDGSWHAPKISDTWPQDGLKTEWSVDIGGGYSGISVAADRVITMDRRVSQAAADRSDQDAAAPPKLEFERVLCFDLQSGKELWTFEYEQPYGALDYGNGPRAAPTIYGDVVLTLGALGRFNCLNVADGSMIWSHDLVKDFNGRPPMWGYAASPQVLNDTVIVFGGGNEGYCVLAFDLKTGRLKWHSLSDEAGYSWPVPVRRSTHTHLVCWTPSHIRGIDAADGRPLWSIPYEVTYGVSIATPIVHEDIVLVCGYWAGSRAIKLHEHAVDVKLLWEENRYLRGLMSQPLYRDGYVYLLDKQYGLTCFELKTGRKLWDDKNTLTPRGRNPQASIVWLNEEGRTDQNRIISLNSEGELGLLSVTPDGFVEHARSRIIDPTWAHPAFAGYRVLARSDQKLVCIQLPSGK
jgi:outer membrane protein assembly factor BamB